MVSRRQTRSLHSPPPSIDQRCLAAEVPVWVRDLLTLRAYLRLLGWSQRALAERAGVGHATVNHLLSGRRATCSRHTATAIEQALACPSGLFFTSERPGGVLESGPVRE